MLGVHVSLPGICTRTSLPDIHARFSSEIDRIFWRKRDSLREIKRINKYISDTQAGNAEIEQRLEKLCGVTKPGHITIQLISASGNTYQLPIQPSFIQFLDEKGNPHRTLTTIADVKGKVEETCGIDAVSQMLFRDNADDELEDDVTIEECGLFGDQTMYLVVDTDRLYWYQHAKLVRQYKLPIVHVIRLMPEFMNSDEQSQSPKGRSRLVEFLRNCRKALGLMLERPAVHQVRSLKDLRQIERFLREVVMPIYEATSGSHSP
jgi:hypothetical protein